LSFRGDDIIQVQHWTSDQTLPPSDSKINQHEERPIKSFSPQQGMIVALRITYQKLSSNSSDLVKLEPKLVYHRKIRIGPVAPRRRWRMFQLLLRRLRLRHKTSAWASGGPTGGRRVATCFRWWLVLPKRDPPRRVQRRDIHCALF
jgi:hypothetical protein